MTPSQHAQELERLNRQWEQLSTKIDALERQRFHETRVEEKLRIRSVIDEARAERDEVEERIAARQQPTPPGASPDARPGSHPATSIHIHGSVRSKRDIVFGDRSEGTPPPAGNTDRDTRIGGDVEADGDITFGNHHSDRDRR